MKKQRLGRGKKKNSQRRHGKITRPVYVREGIKGNYWMQQVSSYVISVNQY